MRRKSPRATAARLSADEDRVDREVHAMVRTSTIVLSGGGRRRSRRRRSRRSCRMPDDFPGTRRPARRRRCAARPFAALSVSVILEARAVRARREAAAHWSAEERERRCAGGWCISRKAPYKGALRAHSTRARARARASGAYLSSLEPMVIFGHACSGWSGILSLRRSSARFFSLRSSHLHRLSSPRHASTRRRAS